jgi:hypothetical protein
VNAYAQCFQKNDTKQHINYWSCFIKASADAERGSKLQLNGAAALLGFSGFQFNGYNY